MHTEAIETKPVATADAERLATINAVLEEIRPALIRDGGDCRALHWTVLRSGDEIANLAKGPFDV